MFGSIKLFTVRGIPIRAHFTALLLVVLLVADMGAFGVPAGLLLMLSILLHELGHALMGRRFGVQTRSIDLHILGGTAFMQDMPKKPRHEILIALAGPADKAAAAAAFPYLERIVAYPTIVFVDRDGAARAVFSGFTGPAAPTDHARLVAQWRSILDALVR